MDNDKQSDFSQHAKCPHQTRCDSRITMIFKVNTKKSIIRTMAHRLKRTSKKQGDYNRAFDYLRKVKVQRTILGTINFVLHKQAAYAIGN